MALESISVLQEWLRWDGVGNISEDGCVVVDFFNSGSELEAECGNFANDVRAEIFGQAASHIASQVVDGFDQSSSDCVVCGIGEGDWVGRDVEGYCAVISEEVGNIGSIEVTEESSGFDGPSVSSNIVLVAGIVGSGVGSLDSSSNDDLTVASEVGSWGETPEGLEDLVLILRKSVKDGNTSNSGVVNGESKTNCSFLGNCFGVEFCWQES